MTYKRLKDALKRYRTVKNSRMLRDAKGKLDPWNVGGTHGGRRSKKRGREDDGMERGRSRSRHKNNQKNEIQLLKTTTVHVTAWGLKIRFFSLKSPRLRLIQAQNLWTSSSPMPSQKDP
jgi:hypothetical protein